MTALLAPRQAARKRPAPAEAPPAPAGVPSPPPRTTEDWAICCSGGGIRSATYCLGGLQSLDEGGLLGRARWILGVSGGSYIAASRALVAHNLRQDGRQRPANARQRPAYARGTAEEQNLRNNTHYIAPDAKTVLVAILSLLLGTAVTCIFALVPVYALSHALGWLLHARGVLTWSGGKASASVTAWTWWLWPAAAGAIMLALFAFWWLTLGSGGPGRGARRARPVGWAAASAAGLALVMLGAPPLIAWLYHSTGALGTIMRFFGFGGSGHWSPAALGGLVTAMVAAAQAGQKQMSKLSLPKAAGGSPSGAIGKLGTWAVGRLTPWLASVLIIAAGAFAALLWMNSGGRAGFSLAQLVPVLVAVALMLVTRIAADINRTSMHDFYRWRLADAFAVTREAAAEAEPEAREKLLAAAARTRLSELASDDGEPTLVIATTANINACREVPPGRGGFCLAFDPESVTLRGEPHSPEPKAQAATADYERLLGHTRLTLFDVVAISGAAFSPLMGSATRSAYRIVFTLANLRLGVWMPHPNVVSNARNYLNDAAASGKKDRWWNSLLLLWYVSPHPFWRRNARKKATIEGREARLWAHVLRLRERSARSPGGLRSIPARLHAAVCWRAMQPTLGMLWAEAAGHTSYRATWINVTDGGHYDNLGLVEALHRRARNVVVLDASGDRTDTWFTLGGAIALARADAGVEVNLDPTSMIGRNGTGAAPGLEKGQVLRPWARGSFTRPDGRAVTGSETAAARPPASGNLWVCKLGWWEQAPWDIRAYAAGHQTYPCDSTMQQFYDGAEFEAYHELGVCTVAAAAREGQLPLLPRR